MRKLSQKNLLQYCIFTIIISCLVSAVQAADKTAFVGWEKDSPYNQYYNYKERDSLKGKVLQFKEVTPQCRRI